jgi:hypothetical protein
LRLKTLARLVRAEIPPGPLPACGVVCGEAGSAAPASVASTGAPVESLARDWAGIGAGKGIPPAVCATQGFGIEPSAAESAMTNSKLGNLFDLLVIAISP